MEKNQKGCGCGAKTALPKNFGFRPLTASQKDLADRIKAVEERKSKITRNKYL
jgi:hypothetical protein